MERSSRAAGEPAGRFQWGSYGFLAGVLVGLLMGWIFHGFVGAFVRVGLVLVVVVPLVFLYLAWRRYVAPWLRPASESNGHAPMGAIETRAVVRGVVHEPRPR